MGGPRLMGTGEAAVTTAELLEAMTDRGQFELLATAVLRRVNNDYAAIIHLGINAKGETITAPVDGFCHVPSSNPPRYLLLAHTTTDRERLARKWLFDHTKSKSNKGKASDDGDMVKAGKEAATIRLHATQAAFTVLLATNQRVPLDLVRGIDALATQLQLGYEIWEQSRLTDYLDNDAEGQWLRRRFLRVEAERLSAPLLGELCTRSLAAYERHLLHTEPALWIPRSSEQEIVPASRETASVVLLIGESGCGKSVLACQAIREHLASGGRGLWVPADAVAECHSLDEAIDGARYASSTRALFLAPGGPPSSCGGLVLRSFSSSRTCTRAPRLRRSPAASSPGAGRLGPPRE